jgi:hypothetical protein
MWITDLYMYWISVLYIARMYVLPDVYFHFCSFALFNNLPYIKHNFREGPHNSIMPITAPLAPGQGHSDKFDGFFPHGHSLHCFLSRAGWSLCLPLNGYSVSWPVWCILHAFQSGLLKEHFYWPENTEWKLK